MADEFAYNPDETDEELGSVTLTLEDDTELECMIIGTFEAGEHEYIALLPMTDDENDEEGDVLLYRYIENDNGEPEIANIESDEEYEIAADAFDEMMDEEEFEDEE